MVLAHLEAVLTRIMQTTSRIVRVPREASALQGVACVEEAWRLAHVALISSCHLSRTRWPWVECVDYLACPAAKEDNLGAKALSHVAHAVVPNLQWQHLEPHLSNQILELATMPSTCRSTGQVMDLEVDLEAVSEA